MNKKGFTVVELTVTLTILVILGIIAMFSYVGYSSGARDSVRVGDIGKLMNSIELFDASHGFFPEATSAQSVTYLGVEIWSQGVFGDSTLRLVQNLSDVPKDPLTDNEYAFSRTKKRDEYMLGAMFEGAVSRNLLTKQANAEGVEIANAYLKGQYNGKILRTSSGGTTYVLAVPSIINSNMNILDIEDIITGNLLAYHGYTNLPSSYASSNYNTNGGFDFYSGGDLVVYSGLSRSFSDNLKGNLSHRIELISNLQSFYEGTIISDKDLEIEKLLAVNIDSVNPSNAAKIMAADIVDILLGSSLSITVDIDK